MDWTQIIVALIGAVLGGGLVKILTTKETKEGMSLENMQKVLDAKDKIIEERIERCRELKLELDKKDLKIDEQHKIIANLRHELDEANTKAAVAEVMRCDATKCVTRVPPFGSSLKMAEEINEE